MNADLFDLTKLMINSVLAVIFAATCTYTLFVIFYVQWHNEMLSAIEESVTYDTRF